MVDTDKYVQNIVISSVYCDEIETKYWKYILLTIPLDKNLVRVKISYGKYPKRYLWWMFMDIAIN